MACNCSLVQNSINPQQISKKSRTLPSFYYHIKYSWCKLNRNVSQMPILILLSFKILAARRIILTESYFVWLNLKPKGQGQEPQGQGQGQKIWPRGQGQGQGLTTLSGISRHRRSSHKNAAKQYHSFSPFGNRKKCKL